MDEQILFDRLRYVDRLTEAGISEPHARAHADAMAEALRESVATKSDIALVRADLAHVQSTLDSAIVLAVRDMTIRVGGMAVTLFAALAWIKYFG